jgi:hypothetical protein
LILSFGKEITGERSWPGAKKTGIKENEFRRITFDS